MDCFLAIDIGASSGRHILGNRDGGALALQEVHRFANAPVQNESGAFVWDIERLYASIVEGIMISGERCRSEGKTLVSLSIDTWGADYVLLDGAGKEILPVYAYRDGGSRPFTETTPPFPALYAITGSAFQPFNTVYQLLRDKALGRLAAARHFLMLPEYFSHRLCGNLTEKAASEYTIASTTGLLDANSRSWSKELITALGLPKKLFSPVRLPPYTIGRVKSALGLDAAVVMTGSHDTAAAVSVVEEDALYISSGTWSLLGIQGEPVLSGMAQRGGWTNEGAVSGKIRFLKNIMGLWLLQKLRHELNGAYSFAQLETLSRQAAQNFAALIDVNEERFFNPASIRKELQAACAERNQAVPETPGELGCCIYHSLARSYAAALCDLEAITGRRYGALTIIGGGSKDAYLNELTARYTGKKTLAGPAEAAALGNITLQMKLSEGASRSRFAAI